MWCTKLQEEGKEFGDMKSQEIFPAHHIEKSLTYYYAWQLYRMSYLKGLFKHL